MFIEFRDHLFDNYLEIDEEQKSFLQRLIFLEYVEQVEKDRFNEKSHLTVFNTMSIDMLEYKEDENYEACKCMQDIINRFEEEFEDFK